MSHAGQILVELATGEIVRELTEDDMIISKSKSTRFREMNEETIKITCKNFAKINAEELEALMPTLENSEKAMLLTLIPHVSFKNCCIQYKNGRDMNLKDIMRLSGLSENTAIRVLEGLIRKDIIYKGRNSRSNQYYINPWIVNKGNVVNKVLKNMFKNYKIMSLGGKKWSEVTL